MIQFESVCILHLASYFCDSWLILWHESFYAIFFLARRPDILTVEDLKEFRYMECVLKVKWMEFKRHSYEFDDMIVAVVVIAI